MQQNAYRNYLKEKQIYSKQLEEETQKRLEKILSSNQQPVEPVKEPVTVKPEPVIEVTKKSSLKSNIYYYLTFGYLKNNSK